MPETTYFYWGVSLKREWRVSDSIQWVIDALSNQVIEKKERENHKYDEVRADQDLSWCPTCGCKWEIFEGKLWFSADEPLWKMDICPDCTAE
jgi:uncharacterized protein (UPF0212 family)